MAEYPDEVWVVFACPFCGKERRRKMICVDAVRRAEEAERRVIALTAEIAELRGQLRAAGRDLPLPPGKVIESRSVG